MVVGTAVGATNWTYSSVMFCMSFPMLLCVLAGFGLFLHLSDPLIVPILKQYEPGNKLVTFIFGFVGVVLAIGTYFCVVRIGTYWKLVPFLALQIVTLVILAFSPKSKTFAFLRHGTIGFLMLLTAVFLIGGSMPKASAQVPGFWSRNVDGVIANAMSSEDERGTIYTLTQDRPLPIEPPQCMQVKITPIDGEVLNCDITTHDGATQQCFRTDATGNYANRVFVVDRQSKWWGRDPQTGKYDVFVDNEKVTQYVYWLKPADPKAAQVNVRVEITPSRGFKCAN